MFFMLSKIIWFVKKVIFGILFLYAFNIVVFPLNVMLPINVFNVFLTAFLGFPFILMFCLFLLFIF